MMIVAVVVSDNAFIMLVNIQTIFTEQHLS